MPPCYHQTLTGGNELLSRADRRTRIRTILIILILVTLPCYCLGFVVLQVGRELTKPTVTPTITATNTLAPATFTPTQATTVFIPPTATQTTTPTVTWTPTMTFTQFVPPTRTVTVTPTPSLIPTATQTPVSTNTSPGG